MAIVLLPGWAWRHLALTTWVLAFAAAFLILLVRPGLNGRLDPVAILTIAGMNLVAASVAGGVVGIQRQHLSETYSRSIAQMATSEAQWPIVLSAQAIGIVFVVAATLASPTMAAGVAATLLLTVGLAEDGIVLVELLGRFDPIRLIALQSDRAAHAITVKVGTPADRMIKAAQPILDITVKAADKGDIEVIAEATEAFRRILELYLSKVVPVYGDELLYWLFARCEELVATYAPKSSGLVLPTLVEGITQLGKETARHRNPLNDALDEGTYYACRVLEAVVAASVTAVLSPAAQQATIAVGTIADICLQSRKLITAQEPIRVLRRIGTSTASGSPEVAARSSSGLARLIIRLADTEPTELMAVGDADDAVNGLIAIIDAENSGPDPAHFLTAPMAENSISRVCYAVASAAHQDKRAKHWTKWDSICAGLADLCFSLPTRRNIRNIDWMVRSNAADCCEEILLVLLRLPYRDVQMKIVAERFPRYVEMALGDSDGRLHTDAGLAELLLTAYYQSRETKPAEPILRTLIYDAASAIGGLDGRMRRRLSPALRLVGAAAIRHGDVDMAEAMAKVALPPPPSLSKQIKVPIDLFEVGWGPPTVLHRPHLPELSLPSDHLYSPSQAEYLEVEQRAHRGDRLTPEE